VIVDENDRATQERSNSSYLEALLRYMTLFDPAFTKAKEQSEYAFLETLLGVRGLQDAGWNPYETSFEVIDEMCALHAKAETFKAKRHLELWLYGHVVEASEPYETLANLIDISLGGAFHLVRFPPNDRGVHPSPGVKIDRLREAAQAARMPDLVTPMQEIWDRDLRNAIFHADYSAYGGEVRFRKGGMPLVYGHDQIMVLVNRALAYFTALRLLRSHHISSYTEPKEIAIHPLNVGAPNERAIVMVREGHGAIGLKDAWTEHDVIAGRFHWRIAHYSEEERRLADADPMRASFPARAVRSEDP
jgi:hypothetical protein